MIKEITLRNIESQPMLSIRTQSSVATLGQDMADQFPRISAYIGKEGAQPAGMPMAIYHQFGPDGVDMECAIPVVQPVHGSDDIKAGETPSGRVAVATYFGPYTGLKEAYDAIEQWMDAENLTPSGPPWEVYASDPGAEPDSSKWQTDVCFPVE